MGKSFFTGTDTELYTGSQAFSTKISATPTAYGLTAPLAAAYATLNDTYAAAWLACNDPLTRTKAKVQAKNDAKIALKANASELAKLIDGTATVTNEQKIDLGLSVRATPTPVGNPGLPNNFVATFIGNGAIRLNWKCTNPPGCYGVMYQIFRDAGTGDFKYLGGVGEKTYLDNTLPLNAVNIIYKVQAVRSTGSSDWATFTVTFGVGSGEPVSSQNEAVKIAA